MSFIVKMKVYYFSAAVEGNEKELHCKFYNQLTEGGEQLSLYQNNLLGQ